jgi:competence protein ComEC
MGSILGCIWLYTLFVGATPTVIRAALMGSILILGQRLIPARKSP